MNETLSDQLDNASRRIIASLGIEGSRLRLCSAVQHRSFLMRSWHRNSCACAEPQVQGCLSCLTKFNFTDPIFRPDSLGRVGSLTKAARTTGIVAGLTSRVAADKMLAGPVRRQRVNNPQDIGDQICTSTLFISDNGQYLVPFEYKQLRQPAGNVFVVVIQDENCA
ncbi:unnamed protein product [Fusarium venenatum]|uniref:Uncharacterized protein n=1 Tax=Fusarium venenatum TaxID=56646 RepID=A0A2L2TT01_9HYPO|nr:uncharacterized protein FVRRES_00842 [Fusarium venenatum]CEI64330.1 unnamed protein product [Fusarium venenatum]